MIAVFMKYAIEKKLFDPKPKQDVWQEYLAQYAGHQLIADLKTSIEK